jgi:hypothetical protein
MKFLAIALLVASASQATVVMRLNVAQQVDLADVIFIGTPLCVKKLRLPVMPESHLPS